MQATPFAAAQSSTARRRSWSSPPPATRPIGAPQNSLSQSRSAAAADSVPLGTDLFTSLGARLRPDRERRPVHDAHVHAREVLADDPEREQLRARKDRDHGREEREARDTAAFDDVRDQHYREHSDAEEREDE